VSLKVRVDEETTVKELREVVRKLLLSQRAQWAASLSDWGVYLPHQTDGYDTVYLFNYKMTKKRDTYI
jgi:hypothetical protein